MGAGKQHRPVRHKTEAESGPPLHKEKTKKKKPCLTPLAGKTGVQSNYSDPAYSSVDYQIEN
jgi:hypothetical protein